MSFQFLIGFSRWTDTPDPSTPSGLLKWKKESDGVWYPRITDRFDSWLKLNNITEYTIKKECSNCPTEWDQIIIFSNKNDATLFQLTWMIDV